MNRSIGKKWLVYFIVMLFICSSFASLSATETTKVNYQKRTYNVETPVQQPQQIASNSANIYKLLIIAPKSYTKALQPLVEHKNKVGMTCRLVTLDEIYSKMFWQGRDNAEKIKYFIKTAFDEWGIKYVMLVGDFRKIPVRYCQNEDNNTHYPELEFISELYYADIYDTYGNFSSWDTNNNGIYGEWIGSVAEDNDIDLYPDVYVGRLACRNKLEVKIMVQKIIEYETLTYGCDWFNTMVVVGGDTYLEKDNASWTPYEGEVNCRDALENMSGFTNVSLFTSDGTFEGPNDVIKAISKGCGFLFMSGHGAPQIWSTHPPNSTQWIDGLALKNMPLLMNGEKLPVCVVGGCHNSEFDVHFTRIFEESWMLYTWVPECWSWVLTRKIGGGTIATIGCTGLGMTKEDKDSFSGAGDYLEPTFFKQYGVNGVDILGETWGATISDYLDHYPINWDTPAGGDYAIDAKTAQQWALLGDPSLKIGGYPS